MISIDYQDRRPIYEQIVEKYEMLILKGVLPPDSQMPSVRQLAKELAINPNTIQKALAILEERGFIYPVKGRGNFVSEAASLVEQRRSAWKARLTAMLREGMELGIGMDEVDDITASAYRGER